jgi:hypothetical protein
MKIAVFWDVIPCSRMFTDVSVENAASIIRIYPEDYTVEDRSLHKHCESLEN